MVSGTSECTKAALQRLQIKDHDAIGLHPEYYLVRALKYLDSFTLVGCSASDIPTHVSVEDRV